MALPSDYKPWLLRLSRFFSKDKDEAESNLFPQKEENVNMLGDYREDPTSFYVKAPRGFLYELHMVTLIIRDNVPLNSEKYISSGALTNGISIGICSDNTGRVSNGILPVKVISDYALYIGIEIRPMDYAVNPNTFAVQWEFSKTGGPLWLNGDKGDCIDLLLSDNFSTLIGHTAFIHGLVHEIDKTYQEGDLYAGD